MSGSLVIALHGHLPFVNHPEHPNFLEEDWLFEAVADSYLPLLHVLDGWARDGIDASFTLGLSPPLLTMMGNPQLRDRTTRYLDARRTLIVRYLRSIPHDSPFRPAAQFAHDENERASARYHAAGRDLAHAFAEHHHAGRIELMTCNATHGLVPVLLDEDLVRAQVREAVKVHERETGLRPRGIWLPECGLHPMALQILAEENLVFTFSEDRAVRFAWPPPTHDVYRPIWSPEGVAVFPRDPGSAKEVWSAQEGYPGDFRYREFYRDLGYDADTALLDVVHKQGTGARKNMGLKLHRITGKVTLDAKLPYEPWAAEEAAREHGRHFAARRSEDSEEIQQALGVAPCITAAFDCELFGHWWHEGPWFLDTFMRELARGHTAGHSSPRPVSAYKYLEREPTQQVAWPAVSSWGEGGSFEVWINPKNDWVWRRVHDTRVRLGRAVEAHKHSSDPLVRRALAQAARELMLGASSDWPFILTMGTQTGYAIKQPVVHLARAHRLLEGIEQGGINEPDLSQLEERDFALPDIDWASFNAV